MAEERLSADPQVAADAFRTHMQEILKNDYAQIALTIGEWHWQITVRGDRIPDIQALIIRTMKQGFKVAEEEEAYVPAARNGPADPGYG